MLQSDRMSKEAPMGKRTGEVPTAVEEAKRAYNEEKIRMKFAKTTMTNSLKKVERSIQEFKELEKMVLPEGGLVKRANEVQENIDAVKANHK